MHNLSQAIETLAAQFTAAFPATKPTRRTVGREAEFPVVNDAGHASDVRRLLEAIRSSGATPEACVASYDSHVPNLIVGLDCGDYNYALEVGIGTIEINSRPCQTLFEIETFLAEAVRRLVHNAARFSWRVLGYGIQPVSPPALRIMSPKQRYQSLYRAMGASWLWYTVTAADQCHVAISQPELVQMLNVGNMMAPVLIALCGNSPIFSGKRSPYCSSREGQMAAIHATEHRHGMPARPYTSIGDYIQTVSESTYLILKADGEIIPSHQPFTTYLQEHGPDFDAFLYHEHYIWNSARLRTTYGTIEIRPACQQPWPEQMAAAALTVGLVEAAPQIDEYVQTGIGKEYWSVMQTYHQQAIRVGLAAPQPLPNFLPTIVDLAAAALEQRGYGEERLLSPIYDRLARRQNPAQRARQVFDLDGMNGLLHYATIRPGIVT